jgi:hypothetical protein
VRGIPLRGIALVPADVIRGLRATTAASGTLVIGTLGETHSVTRSRAFQAKLRIAIANGLTGVAGRASLRPLCISPKEAKRARREVHNSDHPTAVERAP